MARSAVGGGTERWRPFRLAPATSERSAAEALAPELELAAALGTAPVGPTEARTAAAKTTRAT